MKIHDVYRDGGIEIRSGDRPILILEDFTGEENDYDVLVRVNPGLPPGIDENLEPVPLPLRFVLSPKPAPVAGEVEIEW